MIAAVMLRGSTLDSMLCRRLRNRRMHSLWTLLVVLARSNAIVWLLVLDVRPIIRFPIISLPISPATSGVAIFRKVSTLSICVVGVGDLV